MSQFQHRAHPTWARRPIALFSIAGAFIAVVGVFFASGKSFYEFRKAADDAAEQRTAAESKPPAMPSLPEPYANYVREHPAWLTAEQSADGVYLPDRKQWMLLAVASSPLDKQNPKLACELKAMRAMVSFRDTFGVAGKAESQNGNATEVIHGTTSGTTSSLPVVGEWRSSDGKSVSILFGKLVDTVR